jgi:hypothetical protein
LSEAPQDGTAAFGQMLDPQVARGHACGRERGQQQQAAIETRAGSFGVLQRCEQKQHTASRDTHALENAQWTRLQAERALRVPGIPEQPEAYQQPQSVQCAAGTQRCWAAR